MTFLCILFVPPVYLLSRKKWGGFVLNAILYGVALLCVASLILIWAAPFFWLLSVGHASWTYRQERTEKHAELLATKMAEKMREVQKP